MKLPKEGADGLPNDGFGCFAAFCQFSQKRFDNFSLFFVHSFLEMILINCQDMAFIELFKR